MRKRIKKAFLPEVITYVTIVWLPIDLLYLYFANGWREPNMVILGIENRTRRHIDTKTIAATLRRKLLNSGKLLFVNAAKRDELLQEQAYQHRNASAATRVGLGKQLGAKYMQAITSA